jgi:osomolarity two-component system response regulator SKN7
MPKMDGIVTTRNIRRYDALTPIVSMTSNFTHNDIMEYIGIGMNDILPKPFSKSTLYDILEKHCAHLKIMQQQQTSTDPLEIPRSLQSANIMPIMNEPSANYAYDNNTTTTTNNLVNNNTNTPSTASSSTPPNNSPTTTTDTGYWQPLDNRKLVWSSSNASPSTSPSNKHHLHPHHHHHHQQANKKQKLHDLYDTTAPSY